VGRVAGTVPTSHGRLCPAESGGLRLPVGKLCGSTREHWSPRQRRRAPDGQTPRSEALLAVWQVQDSNLRRHTPTDLQNDAAHAVTCRFTTPPPNFRTHSARFSERLPRCRSALTFAGSALPGGASSVASGLGVDAVKCFLVSWDPGQDGESGRGGSHRYRPSSRCSRCGSNPNRFVPAQTTDTSCWASPSNSAEGLSGRLI
jgi:hypothetical protein